MVDYPEYKPDGSFERYMKKLNEFGMGSIFSLLLLVFGVVLAAYGLWKNNEGYVGYDEGGIKYTMCDRDGVGWKYYGYGMKMTKSIRLSMMVKYG